MLLKLLKNDYSLNLLNKLYTVIVGLLSSIFLTRYLGVIYRGDYAYITEAVVVLTIIFSLGIHQSYSYFYRNNDGQVFDKYLSIYFLQFIVHSGLAIILGSLVSSQLMIYIFILLPFSVLRQQMASTIAVENIRLGIKLQIFNATIKMISFAIIFFFAESSLLLPVLITAGINIVSVVLYLYFLRVFPKPTINFSFLHEILKFSWLPMLTALLITFNYSIDIFLLKHMGSAVELGLYATAVGIVTYFWLVPDAFKEVLVSRVARSHSIQSTILSIKISVACMILIILGFALFGQVAINLLYGEEFSEAYKVTLILSLGAISMVFYKMIGVVLLAEGKRWFYFLSLFLSVVANTVANIITIPLFGMYGAALSSIISYSICGISFLYYFIWYKNISVREVIIFKFSEIKQLKNALKRG